jgi:hypothetical protein
MGGEGGQCIEPYHLHVPIVMKSGSFNLLETSGPVQAYIWIALSLPSPLHDRQNNL